MTLLLAAVGATAAALFELSAGPYLRVASAQPHLVLVLGVIVTVAAGLEVGLAWGFVGGLVLDVLAQRPLGSSSFALVLAAGGASALGQFGAKLRPLITVPATFLLSMLYSMILFLAFNALRATVPIADPAAAILPGAVYDAVLAGLVGPLAILAHDRRVEDERVDW